MKPTLASIAAGTARECVDQNVADVPEQSLSTQGSLNCVNFRPAGTHGASFQFTLPEQESVSSRVFKESRGLVDSKIR
jgi:hypothetical protein